MPQTANDVRKLAEGLEGTRAKDVYVVVKQGDLVRTDDQPTSGEYATIRTEWHGDGLRREPRVRLSVTGGTIPDTADAAFTSQSAFEKFVLPYYVRSKTLEELREELDRFYKKDIICVYHEIGSVTGGVAREEGLYQIDKNDRHTFMGP